MRRRALSRPVRPGPPRSPQYRARVHHHRTAQTFDLKRKVNIIFTQLKALPCSQWMDSVSNGTCNKHTYDVSSSSQNKLMFSITYFASAHNKESPIFPRPWRFDNAFD